MDFGSETWKWGVVFLLLAVFIIVANQAYVAVTSQEEYAPPTDYLQGDSFDTDHRGGPGAGQPVDVPEQLPDPGARPEPPLPEAPPVAHASGVNWDDVKDPTQE